MNKVFQIAIYGFVLGKFYQLCKTIYKKQYLKAKLSKLCKDNDFSVCIIGSGMSGIAMGIKLKQLGIPFTILSKGKSTWELNNYPGCGCDVASHAYSYSFALNPNWSRKFSGQEEILQYFNNLVEKYDLKKHIINNATVSNCDFDSKTNLYTVQYTINDTEKEKEYNFIVAACGQLNNPKIPMFKGLNTLKIPNFHSANWDYNVNLKNKTIISIGTGASTIQYLPEIAKEAKKVILFQRSAPYIIERSGSGAYHWFHKFMLKYVPGFLLLHRYLFLLLGDVAVYFIVNNKIAKPFQQKFQNIIIDKMKSRITKKPEMQQYLIPKTERLGCKRILISDTWLETLQQDNVEVIPEAVESITKNGIVTKDTKTEYNADVIIFGTGFETDCWIGGINVSCDKKLSIKQIWSDAGGPSAFQGYAVKNIPNFFQLYGPNTNTNSNSVIFCVETQVMVVEAVLKKMLLQKNKRVEIKEDKFDANVKQIQEELQDSVFNSGCNSWYIHDGRLSNNYPSYWTRYYYENFLITLNLQKYFNFDKYNQNRAAL